MLQLEILVVMMEPFSAHGNHMVIIW